MVGWAGLKVGGFQIEIVCIVWINSSNILIFDIINNQV